MKQKLHLLLIIIGTYLLGTFGQLNGCQFPPFQAACSNPNAFIFSHTLCANSSINDAVEVGSAGTNLQIIGPTHGSLSTTLNGIGFSYTYSPTANFTGSDNFFFNLTAVSCNATGTINFNIENTIFSFQNPVTVTQPVTNTVSSAYCAINNFTLLNGPTSGTLQVTVNSYGFTYAYSPNFCFTGTDQFTFSATAVGINETLLVSPVCSNQINTIIFNVDTFPILTFANPINVCENGFVVENGTTNIYSTPSGIPISIYSVPVLPSHGVVNVGPVNPNPTGPDNAIFFIQYQPAFGYTGPDSFVIQQQITGFSGCTGCVGCTGTALVNVNVVAPVFANPVSVTGCGGNITGLLAPEGGSGNYTFSVTGASHGVVNQPLGATAPLFQYVANPGYSGPDIFVYSVQDLACSAATASVGVFVNSAITVSPLNFSTFTQATSTHTISASGGTGSLTYTLPATSIQGGTIVQISGTGSGDFQYTAPCFVGPDSFVFTITDSIGCSVTGSVGITITSSGTPTVSPDFPAVCPNGMVLGHFNITGGSGNYTTFTLITPPSFGQIINVDLTGSGTYLYAYTNITASLTDSFTFIITDSNGCTSVVSTANIFLLGSPQGPQAVNQFYNVCEDGSVNGMFQFTGAVGPQIYTILTLPTHGTVNNNGTSQNFIYAPNPGYTGPDLFTYYYAGIAPCLSLPATISINVLDDIAPTMTTFLSLTACAGSIVSASINPTGGTSPYLSFIQQGPSNGSATGSGGFSLNPMVSYIPNPGFSGVDSFVYQVEDSSPIACFSLTGFAQVNVLSTLAPQVQSFTLLDCQAATITSSFTASGGTLPYNFTYSNGPSHGTITAFNPITGQFTYQPNVGYSGPDGLIYSVLDSNVCQSFTANLGIIVDSTIVIEPLSFGVCAGRVEAGQIIAFGGTQGPNCSFIPGQPACLYSFTYSNGPNHGILNPFDTTNGQFIYNPTSGYTGPDSFDVQVTDALGCFATGTVGITVTDFLTAVPLSLTACTGSSVNGTFVVIGGSGNYTYTLSSPSKGFVTQIGSNQFTYTPTAPFIGTDSFTYIATDVVPSGCPSIPGTVTITFSGTCALIVDPPVIDLTTCFDTSVAGNLTGSGGIPPYVFNFYNGPSHGTLSPFSTGSGAFVYNPSAGFSGQDTFDYQLTDSVDVLSPLTPVIITVESELVVSNISLETCAGSCRQGSFSATGGTGSYIFNVTGSGPSNGQVFIGQNGTFTYCALPGFSGSDSFNYYAADALSCAPQICISDPGTVNITVGFAMPVAMAYTLSSCLNGSINAIFSATGGSGSYVFTYTQPSNGMVTLGNNNSFTYQPITGFVGTDSFTYTALDTITGCQSSPALVTINVNVIPSPIALPVNITACAGISLAGAYSPTGGSGSYTQFDLISGPTQGIVSPAGSTLPGFTYTSSITAMGSDSFTYTVTDSNGCISTLGVVGVNIDEPFANNETFSAPINGSALGLLLGSSGSGSYSYTVNSPSVNGGTITLPLGPVAPIFLYTSPLNFTGIDTFTYMVTDSYCTSSPATITMNVTDLSAQSLNLVGCENTSLQAILQGVGGVGCYVYEVPSTSTNGGTITQPHGNCAPTIVYTPASDYIGTDIFQYRIIDEVGNVSNIATVTVTVNASPIAASILVEGCIGSPVIGNFSATGGSGIYTFAVVLGSGPSFGQVEVTPGTSTFLYLPTGSVGVQDSFNYMVTDSNGCSSQGLVRIITHLAPIANPLTIFTCINIQIQGQLVGIGGSGNYINYTVPVVSTNGGQISHPIANSPQFTYTPALNFIGTDTFTYTVEDSNGCISNPGLVTITVDAPMGSPLSLTGCSGNSISGILTAAGGIPGYVFAFSNGPSFGTLNPFDVNTGIFTYNPTASFGGKDSFTYTITDNNGLGCASVPQLVQLFVDKITANSTGLNVCTNGALSGKVTAQGGIISLTFSQTGTGPTHGSLTLDSSSGLFIYSSMTGYTGPDSFSFIAIDGLPCSSNVATVSINVDQPQAPPVNLIACVNMSTMGMFFGTGGVGPYTYLTPTTSVNGGVVSNSGNGSFTYTPPAIFPSGNPTGFDSFNYWTVDSVGCMSLTGMVNITVEEPIATNLDLTACTNSSLSGELVAISGSGTYTNFQIINAPTEGTIISFCSSTGEFVYEPDPDFVGTDSFTYIVNDSNGCVSQPGTVTITVEEPSANPLTFTTCNGGSLNGTLSQGAVGGTGIYISYTIVNQPSHGIITEFNSVNGNFTYVPDLGFSGFDVFLYMVTDSAGCTSNAGIVTIQIGSLAVVSQTFAACVNTGVNAQLTAIGGSGTYTSFSIVTSAQHGNVMITNPANGAFRYIPNNGYIGIDTFTAVVTDSQGCTSLPQTIFIVVGNPCVFNTTISVCENIAFTGFLSATGGAGNYTFAFTGAGPSNGMVVMVDPTIGEFTYIPNLDFIGTDSFSYIAIDSAGCKSNKGTVFITVGNNIVPITTNYETCKNSFLQALASVTGGNGLYTYSLTGTGPTHGTLLSFCTTNGAFTYVPDGDFVGTDSFEYIAVDSTGCSTNTIIANIQVNSLPIALPVLSSICQSGSDMITLSATGGSGTYILYSPSPTSFNGGTIESPSGGGPTVLYIPPSSFVPIDGFNYTVTDSNNCMSECGVVLINLASAPIGIGIEVPEFAGQLIGGQLQVSGGTPPYTFALATPPTQGVATVSTTGAWTYISEQTAAGTDMFTYTVTDSAGCVTTRVKGRAPVPSDTVIIDIRGSGYPFDIIPDSCPL